MSLKVGDLKEVVLDATAQQQDRLTPVLPVEWIACVWLDAITVLVQGMATSLRWGGPGAGICQRDSVLLLR